MYKKLLSYVAAAALTVSMIFSTGVTAFAAGPETSTSSQETSTSETNSNSETSSETNSNSETSSGTNSSSTPADQTTTVTVSGTYGNVDVSGDNAIGVDAGSGDNINIAGHVSADANGTPSGEIIGVQANDGAQVHVYQLEGDDDLSNFPYVYGRSEGVKTDGDANIYIRGTITGGSNGAIVITPDDDETHGRIDTVSAVVGDVKPDKTYGTSINVDASNYNTNSAKTYSDVDSAVADIMNDVPDIYLYKIYGEIAATNATVNVTSTDTGSASETTPTDISTALTNAVYEAINYYVYGLSGVSIQKEGSTSSNTITAKYYSDSNANNSNVIRITGVESGEELIVHNAHLVPGSDGTFTLWIDKKEGDVYITKRTLIRPVVDENNNVTYEVVPQQNQVVETPAAPESASGIVVATTQNETTTPPEVLAAIGYKPARTVSMNMNTVTPKQYKEAVITNIATAPANGALNIETNGVSVFDAAMMEAFASRPDVDVNVMFTYNGVRYLVTIPAGYNVKSLLDSNGYCGYLRLMSILGGVTIY